MIPHSPLKSSPLLHVSFSRHRVLNATSRLNTPIMSLQKKIVVSKDGPYLVSGNISLTIQVITPDKEGFSWDWKQGKTFDTKSEYALCRCYSLRVP